MIWKLIAVCFISFIILIAGFLTPNTYSWTKNTVSQLAAQKYQNRWIMRLGFIGFGILLVINYVVDLQNALIFWYYTLPLSIYGICISITGIFCSKPFEENKQFSKREEKMHSIFAQLAGFSLSMAIVIHFLTAIDLDTLIAAIFHLITLIFVVGMSLMIARYEKNRGLIQRIMWAGTFLWLLLLAY